MLIGEEVSSLLQVSFERLSGALPVSSECPVSGQGVSSLEYADLSELQRDRKHHYYPIDGKPHVT